MKGLVSMGRVYNFSAGPAVLPEEVLREAAAEMLDYQGTGMSVMEMSHRSAAFKGIIEEAEADLRDLMNIPDNYKVLFLQGGATQQFAAIPMNLMLNGKADYVVSGSWSKKAFKEAQLFGDARCVASSEDGNFSYIPNVDELEFREDADYVYICENETIYGTHYRSMVWCTAVFRRTSVLLAWLSLSFAKILSRMNGCPIRLPSCAIRLRQMLTACRILLRAMASTFAERSSSG